MSNLNARINAWWLMIGAIGGAIYLGELALVLIQSSYGADVAVLGKSVETLRVVA